MAKSLPTLPHPRWVAHIHLPLFCRRRQVARASLRCDDVEDLVQEALLQVLLTLDRIEGDDATPWAFSTLDNSSQRREDYEARVHVDHSIERAALDFELDRRGLHCGYRVFGRSWCTPGAEPGWFDGACTLGWETLIVRFPEITSRWRSRLLDLPDDHGI